MRKRVLFICTHNSARSQMAEAFLNTLYGERFVAFSAGTHPSGVHPYAIRVMKEEGVDLFTQRSKSIDEFLEMQCDYVITVCRHADKICPSFPGKTKIIRAGFDDPPKLAEGAKSEKEALSHYRRVRDEIKAFVSRLYEELTKSHGGIRR